MNCVNQSGTSANAMVNVQGIEWHVYVCVWVGSIPIVLRLCVVVLIVPESPEFSQLLNIKYGGDSVAETIEVCWNEVVRHNLILRIRGVLIG